jgi:hypothetical protein
MTMLDHEGLLSKKAEHPDWIWNRSDSHVILGVPESPEGFKTIVEPGNSFSPGFRSYGVSTWISIDGRLFAPEELDLTELHWRYAGGYLPVLECTWRAGAVEVRSSLFTEGDQSTRDFRVHLSVVASNMAAGPVDATLHVVIRSFGPAGAPITSLASAGRDVKVNGGVVLTFDRLPDRARLIDHGSSGLDIGAVLRDGAPASGDPVEDPSGWASGSFDFELSLAPAASATTLATAFVHANDPMLPWLHRTEGEPFEQPDRERFLAEWEQALPIRLDLPDPRYAEAMQAQVAYLAMSTVGTQPRIAPISYPLWWLRDGAYVLVAQMKGGQRAWVDRAIRDVADREPFGGFGAEGDGAAHLIWLISEYYLMTGDKDFLLEFYPYIERNVRLILQLLETEQPVFGSTEVRTPELMFSPQADLMAAPAKDGLITGRMDLHFPILWINGWAQFALGRAAQCADALGLDSTAIADRREELLGAIHAFKDKHFGENDRDLGSSLWPTGWASPDDPVIQAGFARFWDEVRFAGGKYRPEPEWTYFEAAQAHNYALLGERDKAWVIIEAFLSQHAAQGLYTYHEGIGDVNSSLQWQRARGWDDIPHVTPHGWTAAELFLALRDGLVRETPAGELAIGMAVPVAWMSSDFSAHGLPTYFGLVDLDYSAERHELSVRVERGAPAIVSELPVEVTVISTAPSPAAAEEGGA